MSRVIYEWDPKKAKANLRRHTVSFDEAASVFTDPSALTFDDPAHSFDEPRSLSGRLASSAFCFFHMPTVVTITCGS